jgi:hypothetical protein
MAHNAAWDHRHDGLIRHSLFLFHVQDQRDSHVLLTPACAKHGKPRSPRNCRNDSGTVMGHAPRVSGPAGYFLSAGGPHEGREKRT